MKGFALLGLMLAACSSTTTTTGTGTPPGFDAGAAPTAPKNPTGVSDAPTFAGYQSGFDDTVAAGNTPIPAGVICSPSSADDEDIEYGCVVYVSKTQTAKSTGGWSCTGENMTRTGGNPVITSPVLPTVTPPAGADFGFGIPKSAFTSLGELQLTADCKQGGGVVVSRVYALSVQASP